MLFRLFITVIVLAGITLSASYFQYNKLLHLPIKLPAEGLIFEIEKGETLNAVFNRLKTQNVIQSIWPAKIYTRLNNLGRNIKAGEFKLAAPLTVPELIEYISANNQISYSIQFIEGSTYLDALKVLSSNSKLKQSLIGLTMIELRDALGVSGVSHLEGQLYPDTYFFHKGDSDLDILKRANQRLSNILEEEWQNRQKGLPLETPYDALILASIIEKETGVPEERSEIAGVFIRRLEKKMRLQTDPTVIYGLGDRYQGNITRKHLLEETAYNTYRISGLPPTPIALVGREAIHAALNPKTGKSLYFVAKGDGSHHFSETIEEHNRAVRKYQLKRRSDYRSSAK